MTSKVFKKREVLQRSSSLFSCQLCGKSFHKETMLKLHRRMHQRSRNSSLTKVTNNEYNSYTKTRNCHLEDELSSIYGNSDSFLDSISNGIPSSKIEIQEQTFKSEEVAAFSNSLINRNGMHKIEDLKKGIINECKDDKWSDTEGQSMRVFNNQVEETILPDSDQVIFELSNLFKKSEANNLKPPKDDSKNEKINEVKSGETMNQIKLDLNAQSELLRAPKAELCEQIQANLEFLGDLSKSRTISKRSTKNDNDWLNDLNNQSKSF
mmetsp:Transcript_20173/g.17876  ORF Transcript_20173/g.17876 Transcript_20173/m.17876 type:complete len:266 (-) Transcript_20173:260-1057(-)